VTVSFWGSTGRILRVDLNNGKMTVEMLDEGTVRKYMGGTCLGMKYLLEEVAPEGQWSAPENRIFVGSGPLGGTGVPGSGSISFVAKGAMTNGSVSTQANGFFGAFFEACRLRWNNDSRRRRSLAISMHRRRGESVPARCLAFNRPRHMGYGGND